MALQRHHPHGENYRVRLPQKRNSCLLWRVWSWEKTRMLEEGGNILRHKMGLDAQRVFSVIVPYSDGFRPCPVENLMSIEASFSWRLLYRFFLDGNCLLSFPEWFESRLPVNAAELWLGGAIKAIELKLRRKLHDNDSQLYLFLGVDDYQVINEVHTEQQDATVSLLHELVDQVGDFLCRQSPRTPSSSCLVVIPMFAGTDWGAIESPYNPIYFPVFKVPMTFLTMDQMLGMLKGNARYASLLRDAKIRRHLLSLGGVPQWVVEYLLFVKEATGEKGKARLNTIENCFRVIWSKYVDKYLGLMKRDHFIRLATSAVAKQPGSPRTSFYGDVKWSKLRDSSACLLNSTMLGAMGVQVPYALLHSGGSLCDDAFSSVAEREFARSLNDLKKYVDDTMFDVQVWQSWAMFGACVYAVRINALLALGHTTIWLSNLLHGMKTNHTLGDISVKLVPSRVFRSADVFGDSTPRFISEKGNEEHKIDWTAGGCIVVSGDGTTGLDIFFALEDIARPGKLIVFVDQRRREWQPFHFDRYQSVDTYLSTMSASPTFLVDLDARVVQLSMHCVVEPTLTWFTHPRCIMMHESEDFYSTLAIHPACSLPVGDQNH